MKMNTKNFRHGQQHHRRPKQEKATTIKLNVLIISPFRQISVVLYRLYEW